METLTEEQLRIRAWGEDNNIKVKEEQRIKNLPTAQELINECD
jgi:hypothetical protein